MHKARLFKAHVWFEIAEGDASQDFLVVAEHARDALDEAGVVANRAGFLMPEAPAHPLRISVVLANAEVFVSDVTLDRMVVNSGAAEADEERST